MVHSARKKSRIHKHTKNIQLHVRRIHTLVEDQAKAIISLRGMNRNLGQSLNAQGAELREQGKQILKLKAELHDAVVKLKKKKKAVDDDEKREETTL